MDICIKHTEELTTVTGHGGESWCRGRPTCSAAPWNVTLLNTLLSSGVSLALFIDLIILGRSAEAAGVLIAGSSWNQIQVKRTLFCLILQKGVPCDEATLSVYTRVSVSVLVNKGWSPLNV